MKGIKNALKFLWGVGLGMSIVQVCYVPESVDGLLIINGWSFASWFYITISAIAVIVILMFYFEDHWDDDK